MAHAVATVSREHAPKKRGAWDVPRRHALLPQPGGFEGAQASGPIARSTLIATWHGLFYSPGGLRGPDVVALAAHAVVLGTAPP